MNREIASAPEKSEADFCARRTAAVLRQRRRTVHTPPDWLLKRVYGAERGKLEKTARRLGACALNVCMLGPFYICVFCLFCVFRPTYPFCLCRYETKVKLPVYFICSSWCSVFPPYFTPANPGAYLD